MVAGASRHHAGRVRFVGAEAADAAGAAGEIELFPLHATSEHAATARIATFFMRMKIILMHEKSLKNEALRPCGSGTDSDRARSRLGLPFFLGPSRSTSSPAQTTHKAPQRWPFF